MNNYFAYGSNLNWSQMKDRCPSATPVGIGKLAGYRFAFTKRSPRRQCGVMDIAPDVQSAVWGMVYQISTEDFSTLDAIEGYAEDGWYRRIQVTVENLEKQLIAMTYSMVHKADHYIPPDIYYKSLVVQGAIDWNLPPDYIAELQAIKTSL